MRAATVARVLSPSIVILCLLASACATPTPAFVVALPNGYYLQRDKSDRPRLVNGGGRTIVPAPIAAYAVYRHIVTGAVGSWLRRGYAYPNEVPYPGSAGARYFVLDTESGNLSTDLDRATWKQRLSQLGAPSSLEITAPVLPR